MSSFPLLQVQEALFTMLSADASLSAMGWRVLDHVRERDVPPYVVIGEDEAQDISAKGSPGMMVEVTVDFWSGDKGFKALKSAMRIVYERLHMQASLSIANQHSLSSHVTYVTAIRDGDGIRRHGIMRVIVPTYGLAATGLRDDEGRLIEIDRED